ncbi:MAG TPA: hypothetical protein V6C58_26910, partial [Allocoleopsis sp.]
MANGEKYMSTQAATETKNKIQLRAVDFFVVSIFKIFCEDKGRRLNLNIPEMNIRKCSKTD